MRLTVLTVGQTRRGPTAELEEDYLKRIGRFAPVVRAIVPASRAATRDERRRAEGRALQAKFAGTTVALDTRGKTFSSEAFRAALEGWRARGEVVFVIGGPDGLDDEAVGAARERLSLGPMTLPHELALVVLLEQLYRALAAGANHPYARH